MLAGNPATRLRPPVRLSLRPLGVEAFPVKARRWCGSLPIPSICITRFTELASPRRGAAIPRWSTPTSVTRIEGSMPEGGGAGEGSEGQGPMIALFALAPWAEGLALLVALALALVVN